VRKADHVGRKRSSRNKLPKETRHGTKNSDIRDPASGSHQSEGRGARGRVRRGFGPIHFLGSREQKGKTIKPEWDSIG